MYRTALTRLLLFGALVPAAFAMQQPEQSRQIPYTGGAIVEQLRSGDRHVVLVSALSPPATQRPEGPFAAWAIRRFAMIVAIQVIAKEPELLRREWPARYRSASVEEAHWIGSRVYARVDFVVKNSPGERLAEGDLVAFLDDNFGSTTIRGTKVDAVTPWARPVETGRRYLLFAETAFADQQPPLMPLLIYEEPLSGGPLRSMRAPVQAPEGRARPFEETAAHVLPPWSLKDAVHWLRLEAAQNERSVP